MTKKAKNEKLSLELSFSPDGTINSYTILRKNQDFSVLSYYYNKIVADLGKTATIDFLKKLMSLEKIKIFFSD